MTWDQADSGKAAGKYGEVSVFYLGKTQFIADKRASGRKKTWLTWKPSGKSRLKGAWLKMDNDPIFSGGHFDFQRPLGYFGPFYGEFRIAANLGVGIYMEGAGYTLDEMLTAVTGFAALYSNANQSSSSFYWGYGYTSAKDGVLPQPYQP